MLGTLITIALGAAVLDELDKRGKKNKKGKNSSHSDYSSKKKDSYHYHCNGRKFKSSADYWKYRYDNDI